VYGHHEKKHLAAFIFAFCSVGSILARRNYIAQIIHYELFDVFLVIFFLKNIKKAPDLNKKVYKV